MVRAEAGPHVLQPPEALHEQRCGDEQHDRERQLRADERAAGAGARGRGGREPQELAARRLHGGDDAEGDPGERRRRDAEGEHAQIERRHHRSERPHADVGPRVRQQRNERPYAEARDHHAGGAARRGEQQALGERVPNQLPARRANRRADRDLALPRDGAPEEEIRRVGAGDQQHEAGGDEQDDERRPHVAHLAARIERRRARAPAGIGVCVFRRELPRDRVELVLRLRERHPRREARDHHHRMVLPIAQRGVFGERHPQIEIRLVELEVLRQDADHGERPAVDQELPADRRRIGAEPPRPDPMREHDDAIAAWLRFLAAERAAERRVDAEHRKEQRRHTHAADRFRRPRRRARVADREVPIAPHRDRVERARALAPVEHVPRRRRRLDAGRDFLRVRLEDVDDALVHAVRNGSIGGNAAGGTAGCR